MTEQKILTAREIVTEIQKTYNINRSERLLIIIRINNLIRQKCKQQKVICAEEMQKGEGTRDNGTSIFYEGIAEEAILNAPLPKYESFS